MVAVALTSTEFIDRLQSFVIAALYLVAVMVRLSAGWRIPSLRRWYFASVALGLATATGQVLAGLGIGSPWMTVLRKFVVLMIVPVVWIRPAVIVSDNPPPGSPSPGQQG